MKYAFVQLIAIGLLMCLSMVQAKSGMCNEEHSKNGMPDDGAACMAYMPRWTYDAAKNACLEFIYGGCGGNNNRFSSQDECEKTCKN
ncbi:male accessory gland serine protease inhibitor [Drosophila grimshawi]|uniref:GH22482 n=1 Tax=Drosophila grimshawi TaxID=7222 RepID=B4K359_DROGR|nr:male accessory gland serine protease inhibitor [Drosophila grimshawi]EDW04600.1 GH22482 [Drosophila grimshawi]